MSLRTIKEVDSALITVKTNKLGNSYNKIIFLLLTFLTFHLNINASTQITIEELSSKVYQLEEQTNILKEKISTLKTKQIILFLGVIIALASLYLSWHKDKLKVSVVPLSMHDKGGLGAGCKNTFDITRSADYFGIEVTNFSNFSVYVRGVGFVLKDSKKRIVIKSSGFYDEIEMPFEIKTQDSKIFKIYRRSIQDKKISKAFVTLSTGKDIIGSSKALDMLIKTL